MTCRPASSTALRNRSCRTKQAAAPVIGECQGAQGVGLNETGKEMDPPRPEGGGGAPPAKK